MPVVSKEEFLKNLTESGVATSELITLWQAGVPVDATVRQLAKTLVDNNHLTEWQAKFLLSGQRKLKFGDYVLVHRIDRNDIGDSFAARQQKLDRLVKVVFLNRSLSAKLSEHKELLRMVAATADIDHDGVEHVHVIDQASGRYMLITDYIDAPTLDDPDLLMKLESDDLPRLLNQILESTAIVHEHGLSHGALTDVDFAVDSRHKMTLKNVAASFLIHNAALETPDAISKASEDKAAIVKICKKLIKRLGSDQDATTQKLAEIVEQVDNNEIDLGRAAEAVEALDPSATLPRFRKHSTLATETPVETPQPQPVQQAPVNSPSEDHSNDNYPDDPVGNEIRAVWIRRTLQATVAVVALGLVIYLATTGWFGGGTSSQDRVAESGSAQNEELPSLESVTGMPERVVDSSSNQSTSVSAHNLEKERQTEPTVGNTNQQATDDGGTSSSLSEASIESAEPPSAETDSPGSSILDAFNSMSSEDDKPVDVDDTVNAAGGQEKGSSSKSTEPVENDVNNEAKAFPTSVDLPDSSSTTEVPLATLFAERVDLELVSDANTHKSKVLFALKGNQAFDWSIELLRNKNADPVQIGTLSVDGNQLKFAWTAKAADEKQSPYLANCILKISDGVTAKSISLRKPVAIDGFTISREQPQARLEIENLNYLPSNAQIELHDLDEKKYGEIYLGERDNNTFSRKNPMMVHFRELPEYQLMFLWLAADLKNRSRLEASLQLKLDPNERSRLATEKSLEIAKQFLEDYANEVKQNHDYLKNVKIADHRARYNLTEEQYKQNQRLDDVRKLKAQLDLSEKRFETFREIQTQLEAFYDQPIPVSIFFEVNGQRVVLATTDKK